MKKIVILDVDEANNSYKVTLGQDYTGKPEHLREYLVYAPNITVAVKRARAEYEKWLKEED